MLIPKHIRKEDKIAIVCTARFVEEHQLEYSIKLLKSWGLQVVLGSTIGKQNHQFGGTDQDRAEDLQRQLDDLDIKAIWMAKGGYGTARILDSINFESLLRNPKWIIGYSDVTALHLKLQQLGIASIHADMPVDLPNKSKQTQTSLKQCIFQEPLNICYSSTKKYVKRSVKGQLIGGNLSVIYSVLGTNGLPSFKNKILFIEDLDEYLYHIDRMMLNLYRNGILSEINGLIVGGMSRMNDNAIRFGKSANEIIEFYTKALNIPVAYGFPAGHLQENLALVFGRKVKLEVEDHKVSLEYF